MKQGYYVILFLSLSDSDNFIRSAYKYYKVMIFNKKKILLIIKIYGFDFVVLGRFFFVGDFKKLFGFFILLVLIVIRKYLK